MDLINREQAIETAINVACHIDYEWEYEQIASAMDRAFQSLPSADYISKVDAITAVGEAIADGRSWYKALKELGNETDEAETEEQ